MSIALNGVRKAFNGTPVLSIDRLDIPKGAQWIITGASGSGKTTFLNLVSGILTPDAGTVTVAGTEITKLPEAARDRFRAEKIGFVFQTFNLLQGFTAVENVLLGMLFADRVDRSRAESLLDRVGLKDKRDQPPDALSVGQQQRVAIARGGRAPGRSPISRKSSWPTSRRAISTPRPGNRSSACSRKSARRTGRRSSASPISRRSCRASRT